MKLTYLGQIFNGVNIMMRWRADKANTRYRLTSLGNLFRDLSRVKTYTNNNNYAISNTLISIMTIIKILFEGL